MVEAVLKMDKVVKRTSIVAKVIFAKSVGICMGKQKLEHVNLRGARGKNALKKSSARRTARRIGGRVEENALNDISVTFLYVIMVPMWSMKNRKVLE